jgi:putative ABC transport system substrate-binding protein
MTLIVPAVKEAVPNLARVAFVFNPDVYFGTYYASVEAAAGRYAVTVISTPVRNATEIERAIEAPFGSAANVGLVLMTDLFMQVHRAPIILQAARNKVPAIYAEAISVRDGGVLSYGADYADIFRRAAPYVDRILRGEKPAELPVQVPTKFEMAINLRTAKTLGLTVPPNLLAIADEVIE